MAEDDAIRATNDDASLCKRFAVQQGYWKDPYIQYFVRSADRKAPEINRGYFARTYSIKVLLRKFLKKTECKCQVLNIGAGFDTTYWNFSDEGLCPTSFIEIDFHAVTAKKCHYIKNRQQLLEKINTEDGEIRLSRHDLHAANYHIVGADLRNLKELEQKLQESGIDKTLPTVCVTECVLVYLEVTKSTALLRWLADNFPTLYFINYEQVNMMDRFGQVMIENLRSRHCLLNGVEYCANLDTQKQRFIAAGFEGAEALEMTAVYKYLPQIEIQRIEKLEFLDETELMEQLFHHYCLSWAFKDSASVGLSSINLLDV